MALSTVFELIFKWLCILSLAVMAVSAVYKDKVPNPEFYDVSQLQEPKQTATDETPFTTTVNKQEYTIIPRFNYELDGVVVSYHNADDLGDIWHHREWKDFINLRDLCVIWGENVATGVYKRIDFHNDSWTCWAAWPDRETGELFKMTDLSNNHLLADNKTVIAALMAAEPGDHIRLRGMLAEYSNPAANFHRGTSTVRTDTGNGACETIYLDEFSVITKANANLRRVYSLSKWLAIISAIGFVVMFVIAPVRVNRD